MRRKARTDVEQLIHSIDNRIEILKTQFNLFFAGELKVPPEKEREDLEKQIRKLLFREDKSPRLNLLIQNVASKFTLYNNMWLKKLHEVEVGLVSIRKKSQAGTESGSRAGKKKGQTVDVSLNNEGSFEKFYQTYCQLTTRKSGSEKRKEQIINSLKSKMIAGNIIDTKINLVVEGGKIKIKFKD